MNEMKKTNMNKGKMASPQKSPPPDVIEDVNSAP
jgi:hypothetical protein